MLEEVDGNWTSIGAAGSSVLADVMLARVVMKARSDRRSREGGAEGEAAREEMRAALMSGPAYRNGSRFRWLTAQKR